MDANLLVVGKAYFLCGYHHVKYPIPRIRTYIYVGKNLDEDNKEANDEYYFEKPEAYFSAKINASGQNNDECGELAETGRLLIPGEHLHLIKDYDGFIEWLISLSKAANANKIF